jgi:hypothetical protein
MAARCIAASLALTIKAQAGQAGAALLRKKVLPGHLQQILTRFLTPGVCHSWQDRDGDSLRKEQLIKTTPATASKTSYRGN